MEHEHNMKKALRLAREAFLANETPIGCVIISAEGEVIGAGRNRVAEKRNSLYHAEITAINEACGAVGDWRLSNTVLYVTVEPCPMCAGAIVMSRVPTVVYGAKNPKAGCAGSIYNLLQDSRFNHRVELVSGVLADECGALMTEFFRNHLNKKSNLSLTGTDRGESEYKLV